MAQCCRIGCWKLYCTVCRTILIELQWWTWIIPLPYWEVFCVRCNVWNVFIVLWPFGVVAQNKALFCIPTQNFIHVRVVSKQNKTAPIALDMTYCMLDLKVPRPRKNTSCRFSFFFLSKLIFFSLFDNSSPKYALRNSVKCVCGSLPPSAGNICYYNYNYITTNSPSKLNTTHFRL